MKQFSVEIFHLFLPENPISPKKKAIDHGEK